MVHNMYSEDDESQEEYINYKQKYRELKKNLRYLIYENESFQDELRKAQRAYVNVSRDRSFLLDRILKYEKPQGQSSDSEVTESSDEDEEKQLIVNTSPAGQRKKITKRKKSEAEFHNGVSGQSLESMKPSQNKPSSGKPSAMKAGFSIKRAKKQPAGRKPGKKDQDNITIKEGETKPGHASSVLKGFKVGGHISHDQASTVEAVNSLAGYQNVEYPFTTIQGSGEGDNMIREEIERRLESRRFSPELNTTATVPAELFSHDPERGSDFEGSEICEYIQMEEDATSEMIIE